MECSPKILVRTRYEMYDPCCWQMNVTKTSKDEFQVALDDIVATFGVHYMGAVLDMYCDVLKQRFHNDLLIIESNLGVGKVEARGKTLAEHISPHIIALKHVHRLQAPPSVNLSYVTDR